MEDSDNASVSLSPSSDDESETEEKDLTVTKQDAAKMVDAMGVVIRGIAQNVVSSREKARDRELNERLKRLEQELLAKLAKANEEIPVLTSEGKKRNIAFEELQSKFNSHDKKMKDLYSQVSLRDKEISYLETNYNSCKDGITKLKAECKCKLRGEEMKDLNIRIDGIVGACNKLFSKLKETDEQQKKEIFELKQLVQEKIEDAATSSSAAAAAAAALRNMTEDERETAILSSLAEGEIDGVHFVMTGSKDAIQGIKSASSDDIQVVIVSKPERFLLRLKHEVCPL